MIAEQTALLPREDPERSRLHSILSDWEYWPAWLFNIPVVGMWLWHGARFGDLKFFTRANPSITTGGLFGDQKHKIYDLIPDQYVPTTRCVLRGSAFDQTISHMHAAGLDFPIIVKPDIGERGNGVQWIDHITSLRRYHEEADYDYLLQEAISYPLEVSVLVYRLPGEDIVHITSVCIKEKLTVTGDGVHTIAELVAKKRRARRQWERLSDRVDGDHILPLGETTVIEPIGNHNRGTRFVDARHLIDDDLRSVMQHLMLAMKGQVYYGRFDMLCRSLEDLKKRQHFAIIEFNGVKSEPAHIYDPDYPLRHAYRDMKEHVAIICKIAEHSKGGQVSWGELWRTWRAYLTHLSTLRQQR